jgi:hypothetical protein
LTLGRPKAEQAVLEYQGYLRIDSGTTWDDTTLLEEVKQTNLELERRDGVRRHFRYDWEEVARYNPDYLAYVQGERERLGENHPLFLTQYRLLPIHGGGGFLNARESTAGEAGRMPAGFTWRAST